MQENNVYFSTLGAFHIEKFLVEINKLLFL